MLCFKLLSSVTLVLAMVSVPAVARHSLSKRATKHDSKPVAAHKGSATPTSDGSQGHICIDKDHCPLVTAFVDGRFVGDKPNVMGYAFDFRNQVPATDGKAPIITRYSDGAIFWSGGPDKESLQLGLNDGDNSLSFVKTRSVGVGPKKDKAGICQVDKNFTCGDTGDKFFFSEKFGLFMALENPFPTMCEPISLQWIPVSGKK